MTLGIDTQTLVIACAVVPPVSFILLMISYFQVTHQKRIELGRLLNERTLKKYSEAYGRGTPDDLIRQYLDWRPCMVPLLLNVFTTALVSFGYLAARSTNADVTLLPPPAPLIPNAVFAGFAGAFLWSQMDAVRRYSSIDLTPSFLYLAWIRFLIGGGIGVLAAIMFEKPFDLVTAFVVGSLPVDIIREWVRKQARTRLEIDNAPQSEAPNLHKLDGATEGIIERLAEENITSIEHLAMGNPLRLLLRTNIEWLVILDLVDQALFQLYACDYAGKLRELCVRSSIEFAEIVELLESEEPDYVRQGNAQCHLIATKLELDLVAVRRLVESIGYDPQVQFIWSLWSDTNAGDDEEDEP